MEGPRVIGYGWMTESGIENGNVGVMKSVAINSESSGTARRESGGKPYRRDASVVGPRYHRSIGKLMAVSERADIGHRGIIWGEVDSKKVQAQGSYTRSKRLLLAPS